MRTSQEPCPICGALRHTVWLGRRSPYWAKCPNVDDEQHQAVFKRWRAEGEALRRKREGA